MRALLQNLRPNLLSHSLGEFLRSLKTKIKEAPKTFSLEWRGERSTAPAAMRFIKPAHTYTERDDRCCRCTFTTRRIMNDARASSSSSSHSRWSMDTRGDWLLSLPFRDGARARAPRKQTCAQARLDASRIIRVREGLYCGTEKRWDAGREFRWALYPCGPRVCIYTALLYWNFRNAANYGEIGFDPRALAYSGGLDSKRVDRVMLTTMGSLTKKGGSREKGSFWVGDD